MGPEEISSIITDIHYLKRLVWFSKKFFLEKRNLKLCLEKTKKIAEKIKSSNLDEETKKKIDKMVKKYEFYKSGEMEFMRRNKMVIMSDKLVTETISLEDIEEFLKTIETLIQCSIRKLLHNADFLCLLIF
jgi:hypothetical protein